MEQSKDIKELVEGTISSTFDYLGRILIVLKPIVDDFYQNSETQNWEQLADLFEGLEWIFGTLANIDSFQNLDTILNDYSIWNEYVHCVLRLKDQLPELEAAMASQDNVLIADLLNYEFYPIFEEAYEKLQLLKPNGDENNAS